MTASRSNSSRRFTARAIASSRKRKSFPQPDSARRFQHRREQGSPSLADLVHRLDRLSRPSLAVLPFRFVAGDERYAALASALPDELITDLARLHWLLVTARGSSFRLRAPDADFGDIGRLLGVRYYLSGAIEASAEQSPRHRRARGHVRWRSHLGRSLLGARSTTCTRCASKSALRCSWRSRFAFRSTKLPLRASPRSKTSMPGPPIISACSTCIASIAVTTAPPPICSGGRRSWIRPLRARTRGCRSSISRVHSCTTRTTSPAPSARRVALRSEASSSIRSIRSSISRWAAPTGCRAISKPAWAGSSARRTSAHTMRKASTHAPGQRCCQAGRSTAGSTSTWRCA